MNETERVEDWCRFIKAQCTQEYKLTVLAHMDKATRLAVLKKLGAKTAEELFEKTSA